MPGSPRVVDTPFGGHLSRAEFVAQVLAIATVIVGNVDKAAAVSRAKWGRQVAKIVRECVHNLGKACA